jgi:DNA-binding transcriptional MerR regulator
MAKTREDNRAASQPLPKLAYNRREAAAMLSISEPTLDRLAERGLLRPSRATRRPLYSIAELERFLRETTASLDEP